MTLEEILHRIGHHLAEVESARAAIKRLAEQALRTPEMGKQPGSEARKALMSWGLTGEEASRLIAEEVRRRQAERRSGTI